MKKKKPLFFCDNCGREVGNNVKTCPGCGRSFISIRCPVCGASGEDSLFLNGCPSCGYSAPPPEAPAPRRKTNSQIGQLPAWLYIFSALSLLIIFIFAAFIITR